jgi:cell division protein FtsL
LNKTQKKQNFLTPARSILLILALLIVSLAIFVPKIYLRNNIYYISKDINKLYSHYISLKEENKFLRQQLEDAKFKNQITDSLIMQSIE